MNLARPGRDIVDRALRTSWIVAAALAATLAPAHPRDAAAILAGQLIAFLHFIFLRKIVKLFTEGRAGASLPGVRRKGSALPLAIAAKTALVYGGLLALLAWGKVGYAPLCVGFALPFLALLLKSFMLALGAGPASLTRRDKKSAFRPVGGALGVALLALSLAALAAAPGVARAQAPDAAHAAHAESGATELPNWLVILHDFNPNNAVVAWLEKNQIIVFAWVAGLLFLFVSWLAMRKPKMVPGPFQNAVEWMVESMEEVSGGLLGSHIEKHFPIIGALFFYILTINLLGIIPGMKSATSSLDLTLALALITFLYVQFWGIRNLGIVGYVDHLAGSPRDAIGWMMLPVMLPVHILGELAKPVSLSCRLFGNIFGEDTLIVVFVSATALCLKASLTALAVPPMAGITALFMMLQTLTSIVQALIFSLLATVYLYMMLPHEKHAHEEAHASH
jgi:F-type H+-transporting ATPase subunit a